MKERRPLIDGLKKPPVVDPRIETNFVFPPKPATEAPSRSTEAPLPTPTVPTNPTASVTRSPISTRIRADFATALKRASLERQLSNTEPNTLQDILEEAIQPWLKTNGYLP